MTEIRQNLLYNNRRFSFVQHRVPSAENPSSCLLAVGYLSFSVLPPISPSAPSLFPPSLPTFLPTTLCLSLSLFLGICLFLCLSLFLSLSSLLSCFSISLSS